MSKCGTFRYYSYTRKDTGVQRTLKNFSFADKFVMDKTIMVVDGNHGTRSMISHTLILEHYGVVSAGSAVEALEMIEAGMRPDLIIAEFDMERGLDGAEFARRIRSNPATFDMPFIIMASEYRLNREQEWKNAGATGCIVKPFTVNELLDSVRRATI